MKRPILHLTRTTAIALGLMALQGNAVSAQPYDMLSGLMVPPCGNKASEVDAGTLEADAFGKNNSITAEMVLEASSRDEVCINGKGKLKLRGESANLVAEDDREVTAESLGVALADAAKETGEQAADAINGLLQNEDTTSVEAEAETTGEADEQAAAAIEEQAAAEAEEQAAADAEAEAAADAEAEAAAQDEAEAAAQAEAEAEAATQAEAEAAAQAEAETAAEAETTAEPRTRLFEQGENGIFQQRPADRPAAESQAEMAEEAESEGRTAEQPAEVEETVITDENSRSSAEDFAANAEGNARASNGNRDEGLSTFEKFALGAAGIIALDAIIGNNREVVSNSGDRVILRDNNGDLEVLRDDDTLLRRPGSDVRTETFSDGSTRTTITRANGTKIVTIADASGRVIKRTRITADGHATILIDDTEEVRPVDVTRLPTPRLERPSIAASDRAALQAALRAESRAQIDRSYTLRQVREYREVRDLMPEINIDAINFETGSAAIQPQEAEELFELGRAMSDFIEENPDELFLVEGHTDAVGSAAYNLALSDRRAESVALALTEYFDVPPENMIIQGYGESELLVETSGAERANRRAVVRRVTPLLR